MSSKRAKAEKNESHQDNGTASNGFLLGLTKEKGIQELDATGIQLDHAYLAWVDLERCTQGLIHFC